MQPARLEGKSTRTVQVQVEVHSNHLHADTLAYLKGRGVMPPDTHLAYAAQMSHPWDDAYIVGHGSTPEEALAALRAKATPILTDETSCWFSVHFPIMVTTMEFEAPEAAFVWPEYFKETVNA